MIEFKTEIEDIIESEPKPLAGIKVTIVYEAASDKEIKIENEIFAHDYNENVGDPSVSHYETHIHSNVLNVGNVLNAVQYHEDNSDLNHDHILDARRKSVEKTKSRNDPKTKNSLQPFLETHPCNFCNIKLICRKYLLKHQQKVHGRYLCDECDEEFSKRSKLTYHRKSRHGPSNLIKTFECDFENCNSKLKSLAGFQYHRQRHTGVQSHICNVCQKLFFRLSDLNRHLLNHIDDRPHTCDICPKTYRTAAKLRNHKYLHIGVKPFVCKFCQKGFSFSTSRRIHERLHTGEKPYTCMLCQKTFRSNTALSTHRKIHTGEKRYLCKVCHKSFTQTNHLKQHERIHTGEKPYVCDVCDYRFSQLGHLNTHQKIHIRGKPFSCKTCQSTFSLKSQLTAHEKIHSRAQIFTCALCDKTFLEKRSLRAHLSKCCKEHTSKEKDHSYTSTSDIQQGSIILRITRQQNPQ